MITQTPDLNLWEPINNVVRLFESYLTWMHPNKKVQFIRLPLWLQRALISVTVFSGLKERGIDYGRKDTQYTHVCYSNMKQWLSYLLNQYLLFIVLLEKVRVFLDFYIILIHSAQIVPIGKVINKTVFTLATITKFKSILTPAPNSPK